MLLLWFGLLLAASLADPSSAREITVHLADALAVQSTNTPENVARFVDSALLQNGFSRDHQTHDLDGTNCVTIYSYRSKDSQSNAGVMCSGCNVHEAPSQVRIELWELGILRPSKQFSKIRHQLKYALSKRCEKDNVR